MKLVNFFTVLCLSLPVFSQCMISDDNPASESSSANTITSQATFVQGDTKTVALGNLSLEVTANSIGGTQAFITVNEESMIISTGNVIESQTIDGLSVEIVSISEKTKAVDSVVTLKFSYTAPAGTTSNDGNDGGDIGGGTGGNETSSSSSSSSS